METWKQQENFAATPLCCISPHAQAWLELLLGGWVRSLGSLRSVGWVGGVEPVRRGSFIQS